jgi:hypothetical protein
VTRFSQCSSAGGAVTAALAVQRALDATSRDIPDARRLRFRIGVHLGDVNERADGDVYGDGVNIAARLQALAQPGGIVVSEAVRGAVKSRVAASFDDLGSQAVKNIAEPVRAFAVRSDGMPKASRAAATPVPLASRRRVWFAAAAAAVLIAVGVTFWQRGAPTGAHRQCRRRDPGKTPTSAQARPRAPWPRRRAAPRSRCCRSTT